MNNKKHNNNKPYIWIVSWYGPPFGFRRQKIFYSKRAALSFKHQLMFEAENDMNCISCITLEKFYE